MGRLLEAAGKASNCPSCQVQAGLTVLRRDLRFLGPAFSQLYLEEGAGRAAAAARAGAGQAQHPLRIDSGFVTCMFDKACCYFSCPEIQSTVGGSSKEKSKYIKNSPLGALNTVGRKCADSQMFSFPHTS